MRPDSEQAFTVEHISPEELRRRIRENTAPLLLDVREPWEHELTHLPGSVLVPLGDLSARQSELNPERETIVYCHHGVRSVEAAFALARAGFRHVYNLRGGIDSYSDLEPSIRRYA